MHESLVGAEHPIEEARRIRAHQLAAQTVERRRARAAQRGLLGREPARADVRIGQERRGHDGLDHRRGHRVVIDRRVEQRVGTIANRIRKTLVAARFAPRPVVFLARAWRQRAGERFDAAARDVDDRDGRHPDHGVLEHPMSEVVRRIFLARKPERTADVLASGIAGGGPLRQRLHRRVDRKVDRKADIDRRSAERDAVGTIAIARRRCGRGPLRVRVQPVQRAGRPLQRRQRLQHDGERRRDAPSLVVGGHIRGRLAGDSDRRARRHGDRRQAPASRARCTSAPRRRASRRRSTPARRRPHRARHSPCRCSRASPPTDCLAPLARAEISTYWSGRQRAIVLSTTVPRQASAPSMRPSARARVATALARSAHCTTNLRPGYSGVSIGTCSVTRSASNQRNASKPTASVTRRFAPVLKRSNAASSSSSWAAMRCAGESVAPCGFASSCRIRFIIPPRPSHSARHCGTPSSSASAVGQCGGDPVAANDRVLERLQRRDLAHADVPVAVASRLRRRIRRPHFGHDDQHGQQHRDDGDARRDRELEQRYRAPVNHSPPVPER